MKPLNRDEPGCNYTSSNCVIWQGPDIPCIKLCKGDSVSDVIFKLATELCDVLTTLDINTYDLSCLNITTCAPKNFHEFLQLMIKTICDLQACCAANPGAPTAPSFNDVILAVAPIYQYTNAFGDLVTTMTVPQYVTAIGNRTNTQEGQINALETTVAGHTDQIQTLQTDVANIPTNNVQLIIPACVAPAVPTDPNVVLISLEQQFCQLQSATGNATQIFSAIQAQCVNLANSPSLNGGGGNMSSIPGWDNTLLNLAAALNNIWLTLCDTRAAILNIQANCCPTGCSGITLNLNAILSGTNLIAYFTGTIPLGFANCLPSGVLVTISDTTGGSFTTYVDLVTDVNNPAGTIIALGATPINLASNITIHVDVCLNNPTTSANCQSVLDYTVVNVANCPSMVYTPTIDTVAYTGLSIAGTNDYEVQLWDNTGTVLVQTQTQSQTFPAAVAGTFSGLVANSLFRIRVIVTNAMGVPTSCPFEPVALIPTIIFPVPLNGAAAFAILAGSGITNTGTSAIIGDVGSDPTATVVGLTPPMVTGTLYVAPNPAVIAAKVDLVNAIADAIARTPVTTVPDAIGGTVFTPGYYDTTGGAIDLVGSVTFDAGGDINAVFIIKAASTLITDIASTVVLINGASFANIFWIVGSSATLGVNSVFNGNILATTSITVNTGADIHGRLLAENGAVTLDTNTLSNI